MTNIKTRTLKCETLGVEWMKKDTIHSSVVLQTKGIHFSILHGGNNQHHPSSFKVSSKTKQYKPEVPVGVDPRKTDDHDETGEAV